MLLSGIKNNGLEYKVILKGPLFSKTQMDLDQYDRGVEFTSEEIRNWNDTWSFPALPTELSAEIFSILRKHPRLDDLEQERWRARPDTELHATAQKTLMDLGSEECPEGFFPVYKGKALIFGNLIQGIISHMPILKLLIHGLKISAKEQRRARETVFIKNLKLSI